MLQESKVRAIIIDDEEKARNILKEFLHTYCSHVEVVTSCKNVPEGVLAINKYQPELVFLDIEMPEYNGFDLLNFFQKINFEIIFVTAYSEYAIRAFEVSAVDYLLKPIDIEALQKAVQKYTQRKQLNMINEQIDLLKSQLQTEDVKKIALPMSDGLIFVDIEDLNYLEADGAYTYLYMRNGSKLYVSKKLKFFEDLLKQRNMIFRPHRSYLIHLNAMKKYIRSEHIIEMQHGVQIPLARERRQEFEELLSAFGIMFKS